MQRLKRLSRGYNMKFDSIYAKTKKKSPGCYTMRTIFHRRRAVPRFRLSRHINPLTAVYIQVIDLAHGIAYINLSNTYVLILYCALHF